MYLQCGLRLDTSPAEIIQSISKRGHVRLVRLWLVVCKLGGGTTILGGGADRWFPVTPLAEIYWFVVDLNPFNNGCNALSAANAHRYQRIPSACAVQLMNSLDRNDCPRGTNRMSE